MRKSRAISEAIFRAFFRERESIHTSFRGWKDTLAARINQPLAANLAALFQNTPSRWSKQFKQNGIEGNTSTTGPCQDINF
jgi:hypothetical protein